jgi:hypothetical protein
MNEAKIDLLFANVWDLWPNKEKEHAARKAFGVLIKSGESYEDFLKACRAYVLSSSNEEYKYQLNNFILQDHWRDILDSVDLKKLEREHADALMLCKAWNKACRPHWCKILDIDSKIPLAKRALTNKFFKENWKNALDLAARIFKHKLREADWRTKLILSFRWFTDVSLDRHVVSKIIEGEYGLPIKDHFKKAQEEIVEIDHGRNKAIAEYFKLMREEKLEDETEEYFNKFIEERCGARSDNASTKITRQDNTGNEGHPFD